MPHKIQKPETLDSTSELWMYHMRRGEFEEAWKISDAVLQSRNGKVYHHLPRHYQNIWNGASLQDKVVLIR